MTLQGRVAVVTGGSKGIGAAVAQALAVAGARVLINYASDPAAASATVAAIIDAGGVALAHRGDMADEATARRLVDLATATWGQVDIWMNNAGADILTGAAREWPLEAKLRRLLEVDVIGTFHGSRAAGQAMQSAGGGSIINVAWDHIGHGYASDYGVLFGASKGAVAGMSASLARQLAPTVRVNVIAPGWIRTAWGETGVGTAHDARIIGMTPLARWGAPADVAGAVLYLASDAASFITGQTIAVNGGVTMG